VHEYSCKPETLRICMMQNMKVMTKGMETVAEYERHCFNSMYSK